MLAYDQWLLVYWSRFILIEKMIVDDDINDGDAENWHTLFDSELMATVYLWICWLDDDVKNEPTLSNCEVIAPGRGNIRPSSKNSPQF